MKEEWKISPYFGVLPLVFSALQRHASAFRSFDHLAIACAFKHHIVNSQPAMQANQARRQLA